MANRRILHTFKQFEQKNPWTTEGGLRWLRFNCRLNGFSEAFVHVNGRVLIDEERFFEAIDRQNAGADGI